jgi:hypothetical protein
MLLHRLIVVDELFVDILLNIGQVGRCSRRGKVDVLFKERVNVERSGVKELRIDEVVKINIESAAVIESR